MLSGQNKHKSCKEPVSYFEDLKIHKIKNAFYIIILEKRSIHLGAEHELLAPQHAHCTPHQGM